MAVKGRGDTRSVGAGRVLGLALVALLAAAPGPARAQDFLESYRAGLDAVERQDWAAAELRMAEAAAERSEAAQRLARYLYFKPYLPHYYLGLARLRQDDCAGALEAWQESERQAVVRAEADAWSTLTEGRAECLRRQEAADEARRIATELGDLLARVERAVDDAAELAPEATAAGIWRQGRPSPADRLASARESLAEARRLAEDPQSAERVRRLADSALSALETLRSQVSNRRQELVAQRGSERQRLEELRGTARRLLDDTGELAAQVPAVAQERGALAAALDAAAGALDGTVPVEVLSDARSRLAEAVATLRRVSQPPPEPLLEAARAYFLGDLERAVELLGALDAEAGEPGSDSPTVRRTRAHAALLRAAARFSLWQMGGAADIELLEAARLDVRAAREADPDLTPLPRAFSPRFLAFFEANLPEEPEQSADGR